MKRLKSAIHDLFWNGVVAVMCCAWTLGIHLVKAWRLLEDNTKQISPDFAKASPGSAPRIVAPLEASIPLARFKPPNSGNQS